METTHRVVIDDARGLDDLGANSVELVVTSPPYPMIEMWDELFADLDPAVGDALNGGDGEAAFERMHAILDDVWAAVDRVLVDGGIACINVGDATRRLDDSFRVYQNHARIIEAFIELGFEPLPEIIWRKPTNSAAKFMGSGMVPPNAYVTLEHEYILPFRQGGDSRSFEPNADRRYQAAYFWEERNRWFSDLWTDLRGTLQSLDDDDLRDRSGAFPFGLPYRLINMYSVYGDTVCDPFLGTGTTSLAAVVAGRNSVGYELDPAFTSVLDRRIDDAPSLARDVIAGRLDAHREFVADERDDGESFAYTADHYDTVVRTKQEQSIRFYSPTDVTETDDGYRVSHEQVEEIDAVVADD
jgi:DNA modification methylase